jgi:hypothetical protein
MASLVFVLDGGVPKLVGTTDTISIRGADGVEAADWDNPLPVSMPTMDTITSLQTQDGSWYADFAAIVGSVPPKLVASPFDGFGNALLFDGVNRGANSQAVDAGNSVTGTPGVSGVGAAATFCLEGFFRTGKSIPTVQIWAGRFGDAGVGAAGSTQPTVFKNTSRLSAIVRDNGGVGQNLTGTTVLLPNTNYAYAYDYDGTTHRLWLSVNGGVANLEASSALSGVEASDGVTHFMIGRADTTTVASDSGYPSLGIHDEVRWSGVSRHVAAYTPSAAPFVNDSSTLGLWHLDQMFGRAAVDIIVGQSGVEAGAGVTTAKTQRMVSASDDANLQPVRNRFAASLGNLTEVTAAGDTDVYIPGSGKRIRLKWAGFSSSPAMPATTKAKIRFGSNAAFYGWWMGAPGAFAHGVVREGAVDEKLTVNCSVAPGASTPLIVNLDVEEF